MSGQKRSASLNYNLDEEELLEKRHKHEEEYRKQEAVVQTCHTKNEQVDILATADASMNYVSMLNVAMSRHRAKFMDLKFSKEARTGVRIKKHGANMRCSVNVRKDDGNIDRNISTLGAEKHDAARRMIIKMREICPGLSFLSKQGKKNGAPSESRADGKNAKQLLNELASSKVLDGEVVYDSHEMDVNPEALENNPEYAVKIWKVVCSVIIADSGTRITMAATATKKKDAERECAESILKEIREKFETKNERIASTFEKLDGKNKKAPEAVPLQAPVAKEDGNLSGEDGDGSGAVSICDEEEDEYDDIMRLFCGVGEEFTLPEGYPIKFARTPEDVERWVEGQLQESGEHLGVYIESGALHEMLGAPDVVPRQSGSIRRARVIAIAGIGGALVCVRGSQQVWPPRSLVHVLQDPAWRKAGILASNAVHEVLKSVVDLQDYAYSVVPERIEMSSNGSIHLPLHGLVRTILNKSVGELYAGAGAAVGEMRSKTAVKVAAISLALYARISRLADARVRNQTGVCALSGFRHLAEQLAGLIPLDS